MIPDGSLGLSCPTRPGSFTALMHLYESNFVRLQWIVEDLREVPDESRSRTQGDLPLHLSVLERNPYTTTLRLTYWFEDAGARVPDPDLTVRVYHDAGLAEVMACRRLHIHRALKAFDTAPGDELSKRWVRNSMLNKWLEYCADHGHRFDRSAAAVLNPG